MSALATETRSEFWSFLPLKSHEPPLIGDPGLSPLDRFILSGLQQTGLSFAPEADRRTLCRRLYLDLIGLPPSPQQTQEFLSDASSDAIEKLVDQLLASAHYGERWGRQWLDVVGYADSNGYIRHDSLRPLAWHYRDYIIQSLNDDKPYDRFWIEQLAGDELVRYSATEQLSPQETQTLIATHYLRNAPDGTDNTEGNETTRVIERYAVLESLLQTTMSSMFGMTIDCARCHDHKFDPIPQRDYYSLQAIFYPAFNVKKWVQPKDRWIYTAGQPQIAQWRASIDQADKDVAALLSTHQAWLAAHQPGGIVNWKDDFEAKSVDNVVIEGSPQDSGPDKLNQEWIEFRSQLATRQRELDAAILAVNAERMPEPTKIAWATDLSPDSPEVPLLHRGDYFQPREMVPPGALSALSEGEFGIVEAATSEITIPPRARTTTGRRLAFARWATQSGSRAAALLARVQVDRMWRGHFGRGLVPSPENFGASGVAPTHPELLEWLASELIDNGWRLKHIHRLIVLSRAYLQSGEAPAIALKKDPQNIGYSSFPVHRLEAEQIRDGMLAVAGVINFKTGGPSVEVVDPGNRQVILAAPSGPGPHEVDRRSIYILLRRSQPLTFLRTFDQASPDPNCVSRGSSTVVAQSLAMLNSEFSQRMGREFANRILAQANPATDDGQIRYAFEVAFSREPCEDELNGCREFLKTQLRRRVDESAEVAQIGALSDLCRLLLATNEFLYLP